MSSNSSAEMESLRLLVIALSNRVTVLEEEYGQRVSLDGDVSNSGDTAWLLAATALVFFMTIPGSSNSDQLKLVVALDHLELIALSYCTA